MPELKRDRVHPFDRNQLEIGIRQIVQVFVDDEVAHIHRLQDDVLRAHGGILLL